MATEAPPSPAAAAVPEKKKTVPKELIARLAQGDEGAPAPAAAPSASAAAAPAAPPAETPPGAAPAAAAAPAPTEPPVKRVKKKPDAGLPPIPASASAPAPAAAPAPATPAAAPTPALRPEDQQDLELAQFAAAQHGDRYSDLPTKLNQWFARRDEYLGGKAKELGGQNSPEFRDFLKGEEFREFVASNAPSYQRGDGKRIYEEFLEHRGAQRALRAVEPELKKLQRKQEEIEKTPVINNVIHTGVREMLAREDPNNDPALGEFCKAPAAFIQQNPIEGEIIATTGNFFRQAMEETMRFTSGLSEVAAGAAPSSTQVWIDQFITAKEREFERHFPNGVRSETDGRIIVSDSQMKRLQAARVPNLRDYRCLQPGEIVGMIAVEGRMEINRKLREERQRLERSGYKRVAVGAPAAEPVKKTPHPSSPPSPLASASPARGAGGGGAPPEGKKWFEKYTDG